MEDYRPIFMVVTFGLLGSAFYMTYRPRRSPAGEADGTGSPVGSGGRDKMLTLNKIVLWAVTVLAVVMLFYPQGVTGLLASNDQFTVDMERTIIRVEGMT